MKYYEVNQDLISELIKMCLRGKEFYGLRKHGLKIYSKFDFNKNENIFKSELDYTFENRMKSIITMSKYYSIDNFTSSPCFYERFIEYLKTHLKFDIEKYANSIECNTEKIMYVFCIMHEVGHTIINMNDYKKYNGIKTYYESEGLYANAKLKKQQFKDIFLDYRIIPNELKADKQAIRLMKKYETQIKEIMKKGYIYEIAEEELEFGF